MKCTWKDCQNNAEVPQFDRNDDIWANLCKEHAEQLENAIEDENPKKLLGYWVKASGGADVMTNKILGK